MIPFRMISTPWPRPWLSLALGLYLSLAGGPTLADSGETKVALSLAELLRSARTVIAGHQALINDPSVGDKGLTGEAVLAQAIGVYREKTGEDLRRLDPNLPYAGLLRAQMAAIREIVEEHQATINARGVGFKGFVPAVFTRLVNERFGRKVGRQARLKVTAPPRLVRNRKARPDAWETEAIAGRLQSPDWPRGNILTAETELDGRTALRVLVPEYYGEGCLSCHGGPAGTIDVTGYPREGGRVGELGGVISITLFR